MANADAGVVDEHIHTAHQVDCFRKGSLHLLQVGDIGIEYAGEIGEFVMDAMAGIGVAVEHAHNRSFIEKPCRSSRADAAGPTGDQDPLCFQAPHAHLRKIKSGRSGYLSARDRESGF